MVVNEWAVDAGIESRKVAGNVGHMKETGKRWVHST